MCGDLQEGIQPPFLDQNTALPSLPPISSSLSFLFLHPSFMCADHIEHFPETS